MSASFFEGVLVERRAVRNLDSVRNRGRGHRRARGNSESGTRGRHARRRRHWIRRHCRNAAIPMSASWLQRLLVRYST